MKNAKELSEDEAAGCEADVEKLISGYMTKLETLISAKEKELMTI
ncbi:MAG: ribosome recycling factor [Clostridia bacterium]|nr:ribosome recycling factor [Clostridia bacterium]